MLFRHFLQHFSQEQSLRKGNKFSSDRITRFYAINILFRIISKTRDTDYKKQT